MKKVFKFLDYCSMQGNIPTSAPCYMETYYRLKKKCLEKKIKMIHVITTLVEAYLNDELDVEV